MYLCSNGPSLEIVVKSTGTLRSAEYRLSFVFTACVSIACTEDRLSLKARAECRSWMEVEGGERVRREDW